MDMTYDFRVAEPGDELAVSILVSNSDGPIIFASLKAERAPLTDSALLRALFAHPLLTRKVIAAIHWEALRLWIKGLKIRSRPRPPEGTITAVGAHGPALRGIIHE